MNYRWGTFARTTVAMIESGSRLVEAPPPPRWMIDEATLEDVADSASGYKLLRKMAGLAVEGKAWRKDAGGEASLAERGRQRGGGGGGADEVGYGERETGGGPAHSANWHPERRWEVLPWLRAPEWVRNDLVQPHETAGGAELQQEEQQARAAGTARAMAATAAHGGHAVAIMGPLAYCTRCASFARIRVGSGLKGTCSAPQEKTKNAVAARLRRLRAGRHPLTGTKLQLE